MLKNIFATQGTMSKVMATRRLQRYKIHKGGNMVEELREMKNLKEQIILAGNILTDEDFAFNILSALSSSWDSFIASAQGLTTSSEIIGRVLQENSHCYDRDTTLSMALFIKGAACLAKTSKKKSKFRTGIFCHACGKEGHIKSDCRSSKRPAPSNYSGNFPGSCRSTSRAHIVELDTEDDSYAFFAHEEVTQDKPEIWLEDTTSQNHIVRDRAAFMTYAETPGSTITGAGACATLGHGDVRVSFTTKTGTVPVTLTDVLHAPSLEYNLLSLGRLSNAGLGFVGRGDELHIVDDSRVIGLGHKSGNLYHMDMKTRTPGSSPDQHALAVRTTRTWYEWHCTLGHINKGQLHALAVHTTHTWYEWHCTLGHINKGQLQEMQHLALVDGMSVDISSDPDFECKTCIQAKHAHAPFPEIASATISSSLTSGDLCRSFPFRATNMSSCLQMPDCDMSRSTL